MREKKKTQGEALDMIGIKEERAALESGICAREGCEHAAVSRAKTSWRRSYCRRCVSQGYHQHRRGRAESIQGWLRESPLDTAPPPLTAAQRAALFWISRPEVRDEQGPPKALICRGLRRRGLLREGHRESSLTPQGLRILEAFGGR